MRLAVMTDAHANLPALEAALTAIDGLGCDAVIHTGDMISMGPLPVQTVTMLLDRGVICLPGNHDLCFAQGLPATCPAGLSEEKFRHQQWTHARLDPALRDTIKTWPRTLLRNYAGLRVLFTHYAWLADGSDFAPFALSSQAAEFDALYGDVPADLVFHGHDHTAHDLTGRRRYVNPGSLGCFTAPVARFAVLDVAADGTYTLDKHAIPYDDAPLIVAFEQNQVPERDFMARVFFGGRFQFLDCPPTPVLS